MSAPEEFCLSRAIQMFALLLLLLLLLLIYRAKVVELILAEQSVKCLQSNGLMPCLQSEYRRYHSTENSLLRVLSDIYCAADCQHVKCSVFSIELQHSTLFTMKYLQQSFGISGSARSGLVSVRKRDKILKARHNGKTRKKL